MLGVNVERVGGLFAEQVKEEMYDRGDHGGVQTREGEN